MPTLESNTKSLWRKSQLNSIISSRLFGSQIDQTHVLGASHVVSTTQQVHLRCLQGSRQCQTKLNGLGCCYRVASCFCRVWGCPEQLCDEINRQGFINFGILFSVWIVKSCLVMYVGPCFHMSTYHEKILDCLFYRYVIEALCVLPRVEFNCVLMIRCIKKLHRMILCNCYQWETTHSLFHFWPKIA